MGSSSRYKHSKGKERKYFRGKSTKSKSNTATNAKRNDKNKSASAQKLMFH